VLVTDFGSAWTNTGALTVGYSGSANQLIVTNGGFVRSSTADIGRIGNNNSVLVTGTNSVWTMSAYLEMGESGAKIIR